MVSFLLVKFSIMMMWKIRNEEWQPLKVVSNAAIVYSFLIKYIMKISRL